MILAELKALAKRILTPNSVLRRIKGRDNRMLIDHAVLRNVRIRIDGNFNEIRVERGVTLRSLEIVIFGDHHRVFVGAGASVNRGGQFWLEDSHGLLSIGAGTTIEEAHLAVTEPGSQIVIGRDCMIANGVEIRTGDSHGIYDSVTRTRINPAKSVNLGDRVWLAAHVVLLKGVRIADDSVVGTGTIVTKPFDQPRVILAGNPARVVREDILWTRTKGPTC